MKRRMCNGARGRAVEEELSLALGEGELQGLALDVTGGHVARRAPLVFPRMMVGLAVVPLTIPLALIMLTAMFGVHLRYGFSSIRLEALTAEGAKFGPIGYEFNLLYLAGLLSLALGGGGAPS